MSNTLEGWLRARRCLRLQIAGLALSSLPLAGCTLEDDVLEELRGALAPRGHGAHSGGCEQDCLGAACLNGQCEPLTLAQGPFRSLVSAEHELYAVEETAVDGGTNFEVVRLALDGSRVERIAGGQSAAGLGKIAVDESYLYGSIWLRPGHSQLWRIPLSGGGFSAEEGGLLLGEVAVGLAAVAKLEVSQDYLVALTTRPTERTLTRTLARFDKRGGAAGVFTTIDPEGGAGLVLAELGADVIQGFAETGGASIVRVPLAGGGPVLVATAEPGEDLRDIARSGDELVVAARSSGPPAPTTGRIARVPAAGGTIVTLGSGDPYRLIADSEFVYYFSAVADRCLEGGSDLYRLPLDGSSAPVLLANEATPGCIETMVSDADAVYCLTNDLNSDVERIRKVSKH